MIRGAIAFGLVLRIDGHYTNREVIITTSLALVVFTTVVFGSTVGILGKCLFDKKEVKKKKIDRESSSSKSPLLNEDQ